MTSSQEEFILNNWKTMIDLGIATQEKLNQVVEGYMKDSFYKLHKSKENRKARQLKYYHTKFNSDTEEAQLRKKQRAEKYRKRYNENEEVREKQKERMRAYRQRQKELLAVAKEHQATALG